MEPIVTIKNGQIRGFATKNYNKSTFYGFKGIPYAKPPLGQLRFRAPMPPESWQSILDCTKERSECYQLDILEKKQIIGSDDCLYLNVYTPSISSEIGLKPVMFWIHGGGFVFGSGNASITGPEFLLTEDIVLVTINYRLGILGFLNFENIPIANTGLKDQVCALKWVQDNIVNFNGDPNNVTIFGESAGSASVHFLILSPMAKGLFHRAILQSGCVLNPWTQAKYFTKQVWLKFGINEDDPMKVLDYLTKLPIEEVYKLQQQLAEKFDPNLQRYFCPCIENVDLENAFMPKNPWEILKSGDYNKVPMIIGLTSKEGMLVHFIKSINNSQIMNKISLHIPHFLQNKIAKENLIEKIKSFYLKGKAIDKADIQDIYDLMTDTFFAIGISTTIKEHIKHQNNHIYYYLITIDTKLNYFKNLLKITEKGVCHADELGYLFTHSKTPEIKPGSLEDISIQRFVRLWTNFAKYENPTPTDKNDTIINTIWKPVDKDNFNYLNIGDTLKMEKDLMLKRIQFWEKYIEDVSYF